jgi:hypothetical protein
MSIASPSPDPTDELAELQDRLYDVVVTRLAQPHATAALRCLSRDAQEAAALAEELADAALRLSNREAPSA